VVFSKKCESCGMPMIDMADFAAKNPRSHYCRYCTNAEGMLQSVDERKAKLTAFLIEDEKLSPEDAEKQAVAQMKKMPAWKGRI
jgi:hypothetical protein